MQESGLIEIIPLTLPYLSRAHILFLPILISLRALCWGGCVGLMAEASLFTDAASGFFFSIDAGSSGEGDLPLQQPQLTP